MLKAEVIKALNDQIQAEFYSSYIYLSMSAWSDDANFDGFAHWMRMQAQEELLHAMKLYDYMTMTGSRVELQAVQQPPLTWDAPLDMFKAALEHERFMTDNINKLVSLAMAESDHATAAMLQWFVSEQVEEEAQVDAICGQLEKMGDFPQGVYMLDRDLAGRATPSLAPSE